MYIIEFAQRLFRKGNIGTIIYLAINILLYITMFGGFADPGMAAVAVMLYFACLCIALSPIGEWIMRMQNGCRKIKRQDYVQRLTPLWDEVYAQAKAKDPTISDHVKFYMSPSGVPNAFATGRKTICITKGFMTYSDEQIKGTLAHEFAHLAHKDTDFLLLISVGNMLMSAIFVVWRIIINIAVGIFAGALRMGFIGTFLTSIFINGLLTFFMWAWTKIGMLLIMHSSRQNEYEADKFAFELGYGNDLCAVLDSFSEGDDSESKSIWAQLRSTHPDTDDRIARLQGYGATYTNMYGHSVHSINANPQNYGYAPETQPVQLPPGGYQQQPHYGSNPVPFGAAALVPPSSHPMPPQPVAQTAPMYAPQSPQASMQTHAQPMQQQYVTPPVPPQQYTAPMQTPQHPPVAPQQFTAPVQPPTPPVVQTYAQSVSVQPQYVTPPEPPQPPQEVVPPIPPVQTCAPVAPPQQFNPPSPPLEQPQQIVTPPEQAQTKTKRICISCSHLLDAASRFCSKCGTDTAQAKLLCHGCDSEVHGNHAFCNNCGTAVIL